MHPLSSEPRCSAMKNCGGWNRTNGFLGQSQALRTSSNCPAVCLHSRFTNRRKVRGEGFEPPSPVSKAGSLPLADPRECPAGVEPAFPAWKAGAFAARPRAHSSLTKFIFRKINSKRKERESNPQGSSLDGFRNRCHRQLACPSVKLPRYGLNVHPRPNRPVSYH